MELESCSNDAERLCYILAALNFRGQHHSVDPNSALSQPNFNLVCDILDWFSCIVSGGERRQTEVSYEELDEQAQVAFLCEAGKLFAQELDIHLNLLVIYKADNGSWTELLKIGRVIYEAARLISSENEATKTLSQDPSKRISDTLTRAQEQLNSAFESLSKQLQTTNSDAPNIRKAEILSQELETLLSSEMSLNEERLKVLNEPLNLDELERVLIDAQSDTVSRLDKLEKANMELEKDLERLDERLGKKELELQESRERMNDLLLKAPAYLNRYEKLYSVYEKVYEDDFNYPEEESTSIGASPTSAVKDIVNAVSRNQIDQDLEMMLDESSWDEGVA